MPRTAVVALGGNAFTREDQTGSYEEMAANAAVMATAVRGLRKLGWRVVVVHGNGPQVGNLAIQQLAGQAQVPAQPLAALVAMTQGMMGSLCALALREALGEQQSDVVSLVTHVQVDPRDPAFSRPTKPIGPFYPADSAARVARERGWTVVEDSGRGYRRVVASPAPAGLVEARAITALLDQGYLVIAAGGGGVPVIGSGARLTPVDAVIDKDLASACLASAIGAQSLVLVTSVDTVMIDFGKPSQRPITTADADEMRLHLRRGQFPDGSMGPKVRACLQFVDDGGQCALITSPRFVAAAFTAHRSAGTRIVAGASGRGAA